MKPSTKNWSSIKPQRKSYYISIYPIFQKYNQTLNRSHFSGHTAPNPLEILHCFAYKRAGYCDKNFKLQMKTIWNLDWLIGTDVWKVGHANQTAVRGKSMVLYILSQALGNKYHDTHFTDEKTMAQWFPPSHTVSKCWRWDYISKAHTSCHLRLQT